MDGELTLLAKSLSCSTSLIFHFCASSLILLNNCFLCKQGTLLNSKSQISINNAEALREAVSKGVNIVIATGKVRWVILLCLFSPNFLMFMDKQLF